MPSNRRHRRGWTILLALGCAVVLHAQAIAAFVALKPVHWPVLWVSVDSSTKDSGDAVMVSNERGDKLVLCAAADPLCKVQVRPNTIVRVDVIPGEHSTFDGWEGCTPIDKGDVLRCEFTVADDGSVKAHFGKQPEEVNVAMLDVPSPPDLIQLPKQKEPAPKKTREQIEAEKLEEQPVEVAIVKPLTPKQLPPPVPPPPPPPQPEAKKQPEQPPPPNMTMVEVPDENEVDKAPDDATHLSDKNRDVTEETRATDTNLEKEQKGQKAQSTPNDNQDDQVGGAEEKIAQNEISKTTSNDRTETSDHSGDAASASGAVVGENGDNGEEGTGENKEPGMLSMRGIEGRGDVVDQGGNGKKVGKKGKPGLQTQLDLDAYERIVGKDRAEKERSIARRDQSNHKGRYQKNLEAIKSALENFTPDVRPGNQTALKTRASPFALYVARMHRKIHELWGFGFLEDLDSKGSDYPLNNEDLYATVELALNPDGTVYKMTIAHTSGITEYDVAALNAVVAAGPYGQTPEKIRSVDGRVYLRWGFYRNWRQCGTFNVEPFILTSIPGGNVALPSDMDTSDGTVSAADAEDDDDLEQRPPKKHEDGPVKDQGTPAGGDTTASAPADDAKVQYAAKEWVNGFSSGSIDRMLKVSAIPFYAGTDVAASNEKDLRGVYQNLIAESGDLRDWKVLSKDDYTTKMGSPFQLTDGSMVVLVSAKEAFAIVLVPTKAGDYRANAVIR